MNGPNKPGSSVTIWAITSILLVLIALPVVGKNMFTRTTVYKPFRAGQSKAGIEFLDKMKTHGYNVWFFDSPMITKPEKVTPTDIQDLATVLAHAKSKKITIVPMSMQMNELSYANINLAEAFPSRGSRFVVEGGKGRFLPDPVAIQNPGFEQGLTGWQIKSPCFKIDKNIRRGGTSSLRADNPTAKYVLATQHIQVKPSTTYEISIYIKTSNIKYTGTDIYPYPARWIGLSVVGGSHYVYHIREPRGVQTNQDWRKHKIAFNSMSNKQVTLRVVASEPGKTTGTIWYDDLSIREVALYETVIRSTTLPVVKTSSGQVFKSGIDYNINVDPKVKKYNEGELLVPAGSSIKQGDTVLVDWYKLANMVTATPSASLVSDEAWSLANNHVKMVDQMFQNPVGWQMKYSEWQICGWDPMVQSRFRNSGDYRAWVIRQTENEYRKANSSREVYIWNDNVDPYHNGAGTGHNPMIWKSAGGAWSGLSNETVVLNWCATNRDKSLRFFAGIEPEYPNKRSFQRQIISGAAFYPNDGNGTWKAWLPLLDSLENDPVNPLPDTAVIGIWYHTYKYNYTEMEDMKNACVKAGRWAPEWPIEPRYVPPAGTLPRKSVVGPTSLSLRFHCSALSGQKIQYGIQYDSRVQLMVVNTLGRTVRTLVNNKSIPAGKHSVDLGSSPLPAGVYFVNLSVDRGANQMTRKIVVL